MCGIVAIFGLKPGTELEPLRRQAVQAAARIRHRGPDWSGVYADAGAVLAHERLAIVDIHGGAQPLRSPDGALALAVNGEIYNHRELETALTMPYAFTTQSDCEVINALWREQGPGFVDSLNGIFAFALWDAAQQRYLIARDPVGVIPLYYGHDHEGRLWVASEMKALMGVCEDVAIFPPGHLLDSAEGTIRPYRRRDWRDYAKVEGQRIEPVALKEALMQAVRRQLMCDVPYGVLLSGGLDSSVVAWCAAQFARNRVEDDGRSEAWWPRLHSFAVGLEGSPDLAAARVAAEALGTAHHEFHFSFEEGLDALSEVIRHIETYDVTTVRASTPMFLLARRIRSMGIKMVLSGEGSDEVFGGYLYFHKAPDAREFHAETLRKLDALHQFDCLRANKSMAAFGIEARVPFLDLAFLDVAMAIDPEQKRVRPRQPGGRPVEKWLLRTAFEGCLPESILWRQKEQFSDGVGYGWIDGLKAHAEAQVSDAEFAGAERRFPINPPQTKEAYFYRRLFESHFPGAAAAATVPGGKSIACSSPAALVWDAAFAKAADPSGRAVAGVHEQAVLSGM
ncbi:asparagine synthase B [Silanimonas lenta]|uniref:asparagine synthase B n=1 Tax=Silanimonas lenta TaxID=265429 RepID=UPI0004162348|nr:asparagine synthase B [Silanimonas lenta]